MKKIIPFVSFCLVFGACSGNKSNSRVIPNWVSKPNDFCAKGEICAVGEGNNMTISYANARNEIAKQFKVNVKGKFKSSIKQQDGVDTTKVSDSVSEITDEILKGINIKESFIDNTGYCYSYATLDKSKLISDLKFEMDEYDTTMLANLSQKPFKFATTKQLFNKREMLNKKYLFLTGTENTKRVSLNDILNAKDRPLVYKLEINDKSLGMEKRLLQKIADNRDKVDNKSLNPDRIIRGEVKLEQAYLNVSGFEKYGISVEIECVENDQVIGSMHLERYKTGRSKAQAIENVKKDVSDYIDQNIDNLLG